MQRNLKKLMAVVIIVLASISVYLTSCGSGTSSTSPNSSGGASLTPVWVYDEIPDLKYAMISRDGKWAIVAASYKTAFLDLANKRKLYELSTSEINNDYVADISISDQGYAVVGTANGIKVFSATQGLIADFSSINGRPIGGEPVKIAPSGNCYYAYGYMKFTVPNNLVWLNEVNLQDSQGNYYSNPNYESSNDLDVSKNGEYVASESSIYNSPVLLYGDGTILWKSSYNNDAVESIKIAYDGSKIVVGTLSEVSVYAKDNPTPLYRWAHNSYSAVVAVSDDGSVVAAGTAGKLAIFLDNSGTPTTISDQPDGSVNDIAISSDGNVIVLATDFGGLEVYNKSGNLKYQHDSQYSGVVGSVGISSDGKIIGCVFEGKFNLYKLP